MKKMWLVMVVAIAVFVMPARLSADSIIPNFVSSVLDADGADDILGNGDDGTFLWTYGLTLSDQDVALSADDYCSGCDLPVPGSAMFQFFDFLGAIDFLGGPSGLAGDFNDVDVSNLESTTGGDWTGIIDTAGLLTIGGTCELAGGIPCPSDDAPPEVLLAYVSGDPIVGDGQQGNLGQVVIRSIFGERDFSRFETYQGQNCSPQLGNCDGEDNPNDVTDTNFGRYRPPLNPVPEPATMLLLGTGLLGIGSRLRKKSKKDNHSV